MCCQMCLASTTVTTMKSRVIDVIEENGLAVGERDEVSPPAGQAVDNAETIVLRRSRPLEIALDGHEPKRVWTTAATVDEALAQLKMTDAAPSASKLVAVTLDEESIGRSGPDIEHERAVAIYDLIEENSFQPVDQPVQPFAEIPGVRFAEVFDFLEGQQGLAVGFAGGPVT